MASHRRFFSETAIGDTPSVTLAGSEHQHLTKVLRAQPGQQVILFDGSGYEFEATIQNIRRSKTELDVNARQLVDRELPFQLVLAVALPKGDRQQWVVEKAVELGVSRLVPLRTEFGVAQPGDKARDRMQRWIVAAAKQSGRNLLMEVNAPTSLGDLVEAESTSAAEVMVAHPSGGEQLPSVLAECPPKLAYVAVVGPEGGFADREIKLVADAGFRIVDLGPRILRIETAAVALLSGLIYGSQR